MPRILVVDDNEINLELIRMLLESGGVQVSTARGAEEAIALARAVLPDLILMDVAMPVIDGLEATRRLKSDARTRDIIVIAVTSHARAEDEAQAREAGCDGYIVKPIEPATFVSQVEAYLDRRGELPRHADDEALDR